MSNFDFLKRFNTDLYNIGSKLEEDVIESPRAVPADATLFLEILVEDIYRLSKKKFNPNLISFYKKIDNLYRLGEITYIFKNKLQDAYNLRNKIHKNLKDDEEEQELAFELHQRLYYISKKYFKDYCDNERYVTIPDYKKPQYHEIKFPNCIICGCDNQEAISNICSKCNKKIENANLVLSIQNNVDLDRFTRRDLIKLGISESDSMSLLMDLSKENVVIKKDRFYSVNEKRLEEYLDEISEYIEIGLLITKFYKNEISTTQIKNTMEYWKGSLNQKPYAEFYRLVNEKIIKKFEENLNTFHNIKKSIKNSEIDEMIIKEWFICEKDEFLKGSINEAFILYNELLIKDFFKYKKKGIADSRILKELDISHNVYNFWRDEFLAEKFFKYSDDIKKDIIIKELRKKNTLDNALKSAKTSKEEFEKMLVISQSSNDNFYKQFKREYILKRQKSLLKHLKNNNLAMAVKLSKISMDEFLKWYFDSQKNGTDFYLESTKVLMAKYLQCRKNGWNKQHILNYLSIPKAVYKSWVNDSELKLFKDFEAKNKEITSNLLKRGLVINNLKEGKNKDEAIISAGFTKAEFFEVYNLSKKEKTDFYQRFDREYMENRKRLFKNLIKSNDFFNTIQKCEISQTDFNQWYLNEQDHFLSDNIETDFYIETTKELMNKYVDARYSGKNKPDSARLVGLSNIIINKWLNHTEFELYSDFKKQINKLTVDLIIKGFEDGKTKGEVSELYDISVKSIEFYINMGKSGLNRCYKVYDLYENKIIPNQLEIFLKDFKSKPINKSLKHSKLSKSELNYYYVLGKTGDSRFSDFYNKLHDLKVKIYVDNILSNKPLKIALKNSGFNKKELEENKSLIDNEILHARISVIADELSKRKINGVKIAKKIGISVDKLYDWYFKGKSGDEKYMEVFLLLEIGYIFPHLAAYNHSLEMGIPQKWLYKKIKKDIGSKEFKIWQDHGLFEQSDFSAILSKGEILDSENFKKLYKKGNFLNASESGDLMEFFEKEILGDFIVKKTVIDKNGVEVESKVIGK